MNGRGEFQAALSVTDFGCKARFRRLFYGADVSLTPSGSMSFTRLPFSRMVRAGLSYGVQGRSRGVHALSIYAYG